MRRVVIGVLWTLGACGTGSEPAGPAPLRARPVEVASEVPMVDAPPANVNDIGRTQDAPPADAGEFAIDGASGAEVRPLADGEAADPDGCTPDCTDRECGDDGCGGSCGVCIGCDGEPDEALCSAGTCVEVCCPLCEGKECGPDGCGGYCGLCPVGTKCQDGQCVENTSCSPQCELPGGGSKDCGPNGCGGACGTCPEGLECTPEGLCVPVVCAPACDGVPPCSPDGCGGICPCPNGATCSPEGTCVDDIGCADGERDELTDIEHWPTVAACAGTFAAMSLRTPRTWLACGDDLGVECAAPEDLCSPGWHICMRNGSGFDLRFRLTAEECHALSAPYVAASNNCANGPEKMPNNTDNPCNLQEPLPCYPDGWCSAPPACGPTQTSRCPHAVWPGKTRIFGLHGGKTDNKGCGHISTDVSYPKQGKLAGVLCCKD